MRHLMSWILRRLNLARRSESHDPDLPKMAKRAERARRNALAVQVELHRRNH